MTFFHTLSPMSLLLGAIAGYVLPQISNLAFRRGWRSAEVPDTLDSDHSAKQIDALVNSIYELTSQVDQRVGKHSVRIHEISDSLSPADSTNTNPVFVAGQALISANQQLQKDLEDAKAEIEKQREQMESCRQESLTDALTNLRNRRAFDRELRRIAGSRCTNARSFLILIDIDHFKRFNDRHGHMVGDQVLKFFARSLVNSFRDGDFIARYGGEEFAVILSGSAIGEDFSLAAAERARELIANHEYNVGALNLKITASFGVKEINGTELEKEIISKADAALYAAKHAGRNCCYFHDGHESRRVATESEEERLPAGAWTSKSFPPHMLADKSPPVTRKEILMSQT